MNAYVDCPGCDVVVQLRNPPKKPTRVRIVCPRCSRRFEALAAPGIPEDVRQAMADVVTKMRRMAE